MGQRGIRVPCPHRMRNFRMRGKKGQRKHRRKRGLRRMHAGALARTRLAAVRLRRTALVARSVVGRMHGGIRRDGPVRHLRHVVARHAGPHGRWLLHRVGLGRDAWRCCSLHHRHGCRRRPGPVQDQDGDQCQAQQGGPRIHVLNVSQSIGRARASGWSGTMSDFRLRQCLHDPETADRMRGSPVSWGHSSAGRAPAWHAGGRRFDPAWLHHLSRHRPSGSVQVSPRPHRLEA